MCIRDRCGWLGSSSSGVSDPTRQDWWVLTAADALTSFVSDSSASNSSNFILPLASIMSVCSGPDSRSFQVKTRAQSYSFLAENESSAESWRGAIEEARKLVCSKQPTAIALTETDSTVLKVKQVLVELDLILQSMVGMLCGDELLLDRYGVKLTMAAHDRSQLLHQLGLQREEEEGLACSRTSQVHLNATAMLSQAEAEHRAVLLQDPSKLQHSTLAQIGENTKRLAALSVMLHALDQEQQNSFSAGGGFGGLRIDSSIHNSANLEHEVVSLQNANLSLSTEVSQLKRSNQQLHEKLESSHSECPPGAAELESSSQPSLQIEMIQLESRQAKSELSEAQAAYNKLREFTAELQHRCRRLESTLYVVQEYVQDEHTPAAQLDASLDAKLAETVDQSVPVLQEWQRRMQFQMVPALKQLKHGAAHTPDSTRALQDAHSQVSALRDQLAASEQQIVDRSVHLLEAPAPQLVTQHVAALEARNRELEQELSALEQLQRQPGSESKTAAGALEASRHGTRLLQDAGESLREELAEVQLKSTAQQLRIEELVQLVARLEQDHAAALGEFECEMAAGYALNKELGTKYIQLQQKATDTMHKLKHLKIQLQEKEQHREEILQQAQTAFNELKEKYVALEQSHQERKHLLKTNEWNRLELNKMMERIQELEALQGGKEPSFKSSQLEEAS
eukprot:TRINITY_DN49640_c0_g2_i4.p1 TRINITY_DN49640_c0_g2~~TRINITY_DN49640_c0_g2_i4.p1  ORF type:complete len:682 (-),score=232.60 TRINITY_DN49640_c0_g2_i4:174-2219(-)